MKPEFFKILSWWMDKLDSLSDVQLKVQPVDGGWTPGQLYVHLLIDTRFYIEQIGICVSNNDHADGKMTSEGESMLRNNAFPNVRIEGDPSHAVMLQPDSKDELRTGLMEIGSAMARLAEEIALTNHHGKTRHPGLGYFGAKEWFQFADMHLRHHQKQLIKFGFGNEKIQN